MEPEQKLYINVIIQALDDFTSKSPVCTHPAEGKVAKIQSTAWLKSNSRDFRDVCDLAQIDADYLRNKVLTATKKEIRKLIDEYNQLVRASTV